MKHNHYINMIEKIDLKVNLYSPAVDSEGNLILLDIGFSPAALEKEA